MDLPPLNLPEFDFRITSKSEDTFIWDPFRKKNILLTPEEWVRQHFLQLMIGDLQYPKSWVRVESGLQYDRRAKRSDITLLHRDGTVFLLVECKAPYIRIDQKSLDQISLYNKSLQADYVAITNGMTHFFWSFQKQDNQYIQLKQAPTYPRSAAI